MWIHHGGDVNERKNKLPKINKNNKKREIMLVGGEGRGTGNRRTRTLRSVQMVKWFLILGKNCVTFTSLRIS